MEIRMDFLPGTIVEPVHDEDDNLVGIKMTPFFMGRRTTSTVARGSVVTENGMVDDFHLMVSGVTGQLRKQSRTESVVPFCDLPQAQQVAAEEEEDDEGEDG